MLVYANSLWFHEDCEVGDLFKSIASWLTDRTRQDIQSSSLMKEHDRSLPKSRRLSCLISDHEYPYMYSVSYYHPDSTTPGRYWITEVGIKRESAHSEIQCTILLKTDEASTRVGTMPQVSCPGVVGALTQSCQLSKRVYGFQPIILNDDVIDDLLITINDKNRKHSIIIISAAPDDSYKVEPYWLCSKIVGLATVIKIPVGYDTRYLAYRLGDEYTPWRGAINLIYPPREINDYWQALSRKLLLADMEEAIYKGKQPTDEILSLLTHRHNLPFSWEHISPSKVKETVLHREIARRRKAAAETGNQDDYVILLEETNTKQDIDIADLNRQLQDNAISIETAEQQYTKEIEEKDFEIGSLKAALEAQYKQSLPIHSISNEQVEALRVIALDEEPTLLQSLIAITTLWPDSCVLLDSALSSAEDSSKFIHKKKAFDLLKILASEYHFHMSESRDREAIQKFGSAYAANEGEAANNKSATDKRTFNYNGEHIYMGKHLKIGVKPSEAETLRIHFHWDAVNQKVVIGYCGKHLDHK